MQTKKEKTKWCNLFDKGSQFEIWKAQTWDNSLLQGHLQLGSVWTTFHAYFWSLSRVAEVGLVWTTVYAYSWSLSYPPLQWSVAQSLFFFTVPLKDWYWQSHNSPSSNKGRFSIILKEFILQTVRKAALLCINCISSTFLKMYFFYLSEKALRIGAALFHLNAKWKHISRPRSNLRFK